MPKVLAQAGSSLADIYNVQGSIAGVDELVTREVALVHEMGATIFSERCSSVIRRITSGALAQNIAFDVVVTDLPRGLWRILSLTVIADTVGRTDRAQVSFHDAIPSVEQDVPLFTWATGNGGTESLIRISDVGAVNNRLQLVPAPGTPFQFPNLGVGVGQRQQVGQIAFRGLTTGFGAGAVTLVALLHIAFMDVGGLNSHGLSVPSW